MMELYCLAPSREHSGRSCGTKLGESAVAVDPRPVVISRVQADYQQLFPPPRCVKYCRQCRMWSVFEPQRPRRQLAGRKREADI